jgi:hypothetical protein
MTSVASAGVITLKVSAIPVPLGPTAGCSLCGCTLGGDIVINNSPPDPGKFISADISTPGFLPSVGPFKTNQRWAG